MVSLIESKDIGIIGVGEGSTPQLKAFFDKIGVAEAEWMPRCNATYKAGIEFAGWSDRPGFERYFHPFPTELDQLHPAQVLLCDARARRTGRDVPAHPDPFFVPTRIAREGLAPLVAGQFPLQRQLRLSFRRASASALSCASVGTARGIEHVEARNRVGRARRARECRRA